jgi:hypothetical protein
LSETRTPVVVSALLLVDFVAVLVAPLLSFWVAKVLTVALTGWTGPGPDIIQGCDSNLMCAESTTFSTVFLVVAAAWLLLVMAANVLVARRMRGRPSPAPLRWLRNQWRNEIRQWREATRAEWADDPFQSA